MPGLNGLLVLLVLGQSQASTPQSSASEPPVSVENIRKGLERPQTLKIPPIETVPVFRATIAEKPFDNPLEAMRRDLAADPGGRGRSGVDVLALATALVKSIQSVRRAHAEADARREVAEALAAFCVEHDCSVLEGGPPPLEGIVLPTKAP